MYRLLLVLIFFCLGKTLSAQHVYTIKADSVKITNNCDTAELIIENHTQNVPGFLYNKGRGRTEFRKGTSKLNDSLYLIGADTLKIPKPPVITASNGLSMVGNSVQLGGTLTGTRHLDLNRYNLLITNGTTYFANQVTAASVIRQPLLILNSHWNTTGSPSAFGIEVTKAASSDYAQPFYVNLRNGTGAVTSMFGLRANRQRLQMEFYDSTSTGSYLHIESNNIKGYLDYAGLAVINLTGYYVPSGGQGMVSGIYDRSEYGPTGGTIGYSSHRIQPIITTAVPSTATVRGIYYALGFSASGSIPNNSNIAFENYNGNVLLNNQAGDAGGRTAIHRGYGNAPTAWLHLGAGLATANSAPLKFTTGPVLTTPEDGAVEYDGTDLYLTTSSVRYKLSKTLTGQLTTNFGGASLAAWNSVTTTLSVAGAQPGDVVTVSENTGAVNPPSITVAGYVTTANTVTLRAYNASNSAVTIASDTYKVRVIK
ncbi:hypothetical protein [Niastella caeni]|uniref:hypothetical protein n=1 Tax=Niastella caeni TaxID=2569763 RepID=UPI001AA09917|nr:hypothetical protein [Niastella caeni]